MKKRLTALLLVMVMVLSLTPQVFADSIDSYPNGVNVMIRSEIPHTYLDVKSGEYTWPLSGRIWSYVTADGKINGPAYCTNHGSGYPNGYIAVNTTPYTGNPKMTAAFSSGYPLVPLATFTSLHPETNGITQDEYGYATQVAVWATLGQVAVDGTSYTAGSETVFRPTDAAKLRVYNAVLAILNSSGGAANVGMRIRANADSDNDTVDLGTDTSLSRAAMENYGGIKTETIGGKKYYTREFVLTCTAMPDSGSVKLQTTGAPAGTVLADASNRILSGGAVTLTAGGSEYSGIFKICVPAAAAEAETAGSVTVQAAAAVASCTFYKVENSHAYEQDFIIADPNSATSSAAGYLKWGESGTDVPETGSIRLLKTDENGAALADAEFDIDGSGGYHDSGTTGSDGSITWTGLPTDQGYTITETLAPEGYRLTEPVTITAKAGQTVYVTVSDSSENTLRIHKQDKQSGYSLEGALFRFEQVDGDFITEGRTGADGLIEFTPDRLPYGSYRVSELSAPEGYEKDNAVKTVNWDGKADVDLYFTNVRKPGFKILKVDANTNIPLSGAYFDIYKDGELIDSVRTNEQGIATVSGVSEGYYEAVERVAPYGYVLDTSRHGMHIDALDPATGEDPVLRITNKLMPALRIVKYDAQTMKPLADVTFAVYKDTELIGEYTTDRGGEIYLYDLEPGTYTAQEIAAPDSHVINSTPQSIELVEGATEMYNLIFFNYLKPGIHLRKVDAQTMQPLANAKFRVTQVGGTFSQEYTTDANGEIDLTGMEPGSYTVVELSAPEHYLIDDAQRIIRIEGGDNAEFVFTNTLKPSFKLVKIDSLSGERIAGATFRIAGIEDGTHYLDRVTDINGEINISDLEQGVYSVQEMAAPDNYVLDKTEYHVELFAGQTSQLVVSNDVKPDLRIVKKDADTGEYLPGAVFKVKKADGATLTAEETNGKGEIILKNMAPGVYEVIEQTPPVGYLPARQSSQLITLTANKLGTVIFTNHAKPSLTVSKVSSVSGEPLKGAKFQVTYRSNNTESGAMRNLGNFLSDGNGQFRLTDLSDGWYTITELEAVEGYSIKEATQEVYIKGGEDRVLTFENIPLSALVVYKYDSVDGTAVTGARFQVKKLTDTSGTGGTVIGTYTTGPNGSFTVTGLSEGAYIVEELSSDSGHVIDSAPQTAYISGKQTDVVELYFGNTPKGSVLIKKIDAVTHEPLSDVEFLVTDSEGTLIGNANGKFVTDSAGTVLIDSLDPSTTLIVKETRARDGYVLDDTPQTVKVRAGHTVSLEFRNAPHGSLIIQKRDSVTGAPLKGVTFTVKTSSGEYVANKGGSISSNGEYVTDANGQIILTGLKPDTYIVTETATISGYILDTTAHSIVVNTNDTQTLNITNTPKGSLVVQKIDSITKEPLAGAEFRITTSDGTLADGNEGLTSSSGLYVTDANGQIYLTNLTPATYIITETKAPENYRLAASSHAIVVRGADTQTVTVADDPLCTLTLLKRDAATKEPLCGAEFHVKYSDGTVVGPNNGRYTTGSDGTVTVSGLKPNATLIVTEEKAPAGYLRDSEAKTIVVRSGAANSLTFDNEPTTTLIIRKYISGSDYEPLAGVCFKVTDGSGAVVGPDAGIYYTDASGEIVISGLEPGTDVTAREISTVDGFVFDGTPQSIQIKSGEVQHLTFWNRRTGSLTIRKLDSVTNQPLTGVTFKITYADGRFVDNTGGKVSSNGLYYTDKNGEIVISGITGTLVVTEEQTIEGYTIDEGTKTQTVTVNADDGQVLTFYNTPTGGVELIKVSEADRSKRIPNTTFEIRRMDDALVATVTTDKNGRAFHALESGSYYAIEIAAAEGYKCDPTPVYFEVKDGKTTSKTITNKPFSGITIHKTDSASGAGIYGVTFMLYDTDKNPVEQIVTDQYGYAYTSKELTAGKYLLRELEAAEGYILDTQYKTVTVRAGRNTTVEWQNTPIMAQVQIIKYAAEDNPVTGQAKGSTLQGAVYEVVRERSGAVVGQIVTDARGVAAVTLPLGRYLIREVSAPAYWQLSGQTFDVTLEYAGQIIKVADYDRPSSLGVTITKTGVKEVLAGDQMTYRFKIANTSNVDLESFFWHDKLPYDITSATALTTGTYNQRLNYRILYRTNYNDYRVLASNLLTTNSYSFRLNALTLSSGEVITDIYFDFGTVPAGFKSTTQPTLTVQVSPTAANGYQVTNRADAGGRYGGTWETGNAGWVTIVRNLNPTNTTVLPKTGF